MKKINESYFFKNFNLFLLKNKLGAIIRISSRFESGAPDAIIKIREYKTPFLIELKIGSDKLRRSQIKMLEKIPFYVLHVSNNNKIFSASCLLYPEKEKDKVSKKIEALANKFIAEIIV